MQAPTQTVMTARRLRRGMTPPEAKLWASLRSRQLAGLKFRRQHPIGPYILDFFSAQVRLAVEVDGSAHDRGEQIRRDTERDAWLAAHGVELLQVLARDVRDNLDWVLTEIAATARPNRS
jgi:very-short-patch-repair endonuclease